jgi:hypothetical protein
MNSVEMTMRQQLAAVCADLESKYPGVTEEIVARFFAGKAPMEMPVAVAAPKTKKEKKVKAKKEEEVVPVAAGDSEAESVSSKKTADGRKRVVSKKMCEAFTTLAQSVGKSDPSAELDRAKTAYKSLSDEELQQKGGDFTTFMHYFLTGAAPAPKEKKVKAKKEKAPSRIERWTPTLTRTLTKIVEDNGGVMNDKHKKSFHEWVDALTEEQFKSAELAGHMRSWVTATLLPRAQVAAGGGVAAPAPLAVAVLTEDASDEEEEDLDEFTHEGETLLIGASGKIYRSTPAGDIWVGNAGVGRFSAVKTPTA